MLSIPLVKIPNIMIDKSVDKKKFKIFWLHAHMKTNYTEEVV